MKELKINENNYKGYIELYKTFYVNEKDEKIIENTINRSVVFNVISVATILLTNNIIVFGVLFASSNIINLGYSVTKIIKEEKQRKKEVKKNYPYVDLSISKEELEKVLQREKILITEVIENIVSFKLDVESYEKRLEEEKKQDILFEDFSELNITEETRKDVLEHPERYTGCDVRTRMGKFYIDEEYDQREEEILARPLPGGEEKGPLLRKKR